MHLLHVLEAAELATELSNGRFFRILSVSSRPVYAHSIVASCSAQGKKAPIPPYHRANTSVVMLRHRMVLTLMHFCALW
jgi:hypothetical protein